MKKILLFLFFIVVFLSSCTKNVETLNDNDGPINENIEFIGIYHNKALNVFYEKGLDEIMRNKKNEIQKNPSVRSSEINNSILANEDITTDLLDLLGKAIVEKYSKEVSKDEIYNFMSEYRREICPILVQMSRENPDMSYAEIFLLYCKNNKIISEYLYAKYSNDLNQNLYSTTRSSTINISSKEAELLNISSTVNQYSLNFWNNRNSGGVQTRLKGSTVRGFVYDSIGAGIGAAISGGTASFFLGAFMSAMQNEWGEK